MKLPEFKYHPNAYDPDLNVFEKKEGVCSVCNRKSELKYRASFYSRNRPDYICPHCIADGTAAEKFKGEFNDYCGIDEGTPEDLKLIISDRTPAYVSWQQGVWLSCCNEPCAFIGYAGSNTIAPFWEEVEADVVDSGYPVDMAKNYLTEDGSGLAGYLFKCTKCGRHRLHIDSD